MGNIIEQIMTDAFAEKARQLHNERKQAHAILDDAEVTPAAALQPRIEELRARSDANFRLYALTEKYHNQDMLLMQEMEKVIAAARRTVSGPDSESYAQLAEALDIYERARREHDRTY